jgi:hypothetical protein
MWTASEIDIVNRIAINDIDGVTAIQGSEKVNLEIHKRKFGAPKSLSLAKAN